MELQGWTPYVPPVPPGVPIQSLFCVGLGLELGKVTAERDFLFSTMFYSTYIGPTLRTTHVEDLDNSGISSAELLSSSSRLATRLLWFSILSLMENT